MRFVKFFAALGFIVSLGSLVGNWYLYEQLQAEKMTSEKLETSLVQTEEENHTLKRQLTEAQAEAERSQMETERLAAQVKDYVAQRDSVKKELQTAQDKNAELQKQIKRLESEKLELKDQINLMKVTEATVAAEADRLPLVPVPTEMMPLPEPSPSPAALTPPKSVSPPKKTEVKPVLAKEIAPKKTAKKDAKPKAKKGEAPKKVTPPAPAPVMEDVRPQQVLTVNRQFNFVVVNVGLRDKIKIGDALRVEQGGKLVAKIQVEKLYENFSACAILEEMKPAQIHEGDLVRIA